MIRLGINTMIWSGGYDGSQLALFERVRSWGYRVVELPVFDFAAVDAGPVRRRLEETGLDATVTSALPAGLSIVHEDAAVRRRTRAWLQGAVEKTAEMGARVLAGPMYAPVGDLPGRRRSAAEWQRAVEEYRELGQAIRTTGVRLAIEPLNRFETYFLNVAADAARLCDEVAQESIGILFDTFHANIEETGIAEALRLAGPRLFHVHLSENDRGVPGSGHVPWLEVADVLAQSGYAGCAVVESFAASIPELARATAMWRDYAASPDDFAQRSIEFLEPLFTGRSKTKTGE